MQETPHVKFSITFDSTPSKPKPIPYVPFFKKYLPKREYIYLRGPYQCQLIDFTIYVIWSRKLPQFPYSMLKREERRREGERGGALLRMGSVAFGWQSPLFSFGFFLRCGSFFGFVDFISLIVFYDFNGRIF